MIITIDGPVATGKSTIAKKLAQAIGFIFFDTGAMYRSLTYAILKNQMDFHNPESLKEFLDQFKLTIKTINHERHYFVENENITQKIRSQEVNDAVSEISALKIVRDKFLSLQRDLAFNVNAVFEGRDMGTVVFPDAELKIFLTGRDEIRAKRRFQEIITKDPEAAQTLTLEKCLDDINKRDAYDSSREFSPLIKAPDAYVIDTSDLTVDEIVYRILECKDVVKTKESF